jgi:hypothetical protein
LPQSLQECGAAVALNGHARVYPAAVATLNRQPLPADDGAGLLAAVEGFERFL